MTRLKSDLTRHLGGGLIRGIQNGCLVAALAGAPIICAADETVGHSRNVIVISSGETLPYRMMQAGLDAFDDYHDMAPNAGQVYFKLKLNQDGDEANAQVSLKIIGDTVSTAVPVAPDGTFTLPRIGKADEEDADLVLNKEKKDFILRVGVSSAGVPKGMRRLGDLRLECEVGMAMAKHKMNLFLRTVASTYLLTTHWCRTDKFIVPSYSDQRIRSASIIDGSQRKALVVFKDGHGYEAPINDNKYPDDDLIEFESDALVTTSQTQKFE